MNESFYCVKGPDLWGDYGDALIAGFVQADRIAGQLVLDRTGPFIPPITFPTYGQAVVVSSEFKASLASAFPYLSFRVVEKGRIVDLPWHDWDRQLPEPPYYPPGGEPENYLEGPPSVSAANELGTLWEVELPVGIDAKYHSTLAIQSRSFEGGVLVRRNSWLGFGFMAAVINPTFRRPIVSSSGRDWLERHAGKWVTFAEVSAIE